MCISIFIKSAQSPLECGDFWYLVLMFEDLLLFFCWIDSETICYVQFFFSPWVSMYRRIDVSLLLVPLLPSKGRNSGSRMLPSKVFSWFPLSFWNRAIDNFSSIFHHHNQVIIYQVHWMCIVIHIFHKTISFLNNYLIDWFYYTMDFTAKQMFFFIFCNSSPTVSAKYYYVTHELRLHQNDRCKRFTLF